jgi:signal transduction histidine kinase
VVIALLVSVILYLHYFTVPDLKYQHAVYRVLFYLPLVLGVFWFGLKGALCVLASVCILYLPYVVSQWQGLSFEDFLRLLEGTLYLIIAFILSFLVEKERRKHQALMRAESLAAVGKAVSEIAHDMKTPLMAIGGFANRVSKKLAPDDPNQKKLGVVIQETDRLESMVKEMLDFGKPFELEPTTGNLNELVRESLEVTQPVAMKVEVTVKPDLDPSLPPFMLDIPRMRQVLLNLITNAVQASPPGEHVLVKTYSNKTAVLDVSDHGSGIKEEDRESVFQPFFSTKKGGTGLGLAIVKKIVEAHGGDVSCHPNSPNGATFKVRLPM